MAAPSRRTSLSRNLGFWLVAAVTLVLLGVVVYTYMGYREAATRLVLERDEQVTELSAARLQQALANYGDLLDSLARSREFSGGGVGTQVDALQAAAPRLSVFDGGVVLLDGRGRVRAALPERPVLIARDWSDRDFFQRLLGGAAMAMGDGQQLFPGDPYTIVLAVPILGDDNAFIGALAGAFRLGEPTLSVFYANIVRLRLGQSGTTYVVDGNGRILFDSESEQVGRFLDLDRLLFFSSLSGSAAALMKDDEDRDVIAAYAPIPGTDWTLIVEDDWAIVTRETSRYRDILLLSFLAALLLPPLGLLLFSRQRRFQFIEVRRPEQEAGWLKGVRDQLRPAQLPAIPGWQLFVKQADGKSAEHDFYDVGLRPDGRLNVILGKLSGGGIQAGVALASTRALLTSAGQRLLGPTESLEECNRLLSSQHPSSLTVHCLSFLLDPMAGLVDYAAAGVSPPRVRNGTIVQDARANGQPLGAGAQAALDAGQLRLDPHGLVILLGPSMLEARDADGRAFADEPLDLVLGEWRSGSQELIERILDAFRSFNAKSPFFQPDRIVIVLERRTAEN